MTSLLSLCKDTLRFIDRMPVWTVLGVVCGLSLAVLARVP